ncbi:MAG: dihydropteroate synthase [Actinomycetota bacterium]
MTVATTTLEGPGGVVAIGDEHPFAIIGERINPTGRAALTGQIVAGDMSAVQADAIAQVRAGARVLDVNAGIPGFDEAELLSNVVRAVHEAVGVPLCIDSSTPEALEAAIPLARGKVLVNSVTAERASLERLLPLVARHGAAVIAMANGEDGISMDPDVRLAAARTVVEAALDHGIPREDVIIDPLAMPIGAAPDAATAMLRTIRLIRDELGVNVSCGASNISFGMPDRRGIDGAFLSIMIAGGMNAAITNPLHRETRKAVLAADLLLGRDAFGAAWIAAHRAEQAEAAAGSDTMAPETPEPIATT